MLEQVLIETVLGALTGYVTNDIALKQLFRDGGFIEQEKDEFIEALLVLLRDEIFTEEQIKRILATKEVEEALYQLSYKFLDEGVLEGFSHLKLNDFPHHQKAKSVLIKYLNRESNSQTESLINIKGIHHNFINLIKSESFSLAIDKLLMHFACESFKEALGESRYNSLMVKKISHETFFQQEHIQEKISDFYDDLLESNVQLGQYISLTPEKMGLFFTRLIREVFANLNEDKLKKIVEKISNYNDGVLLEAFKALENQLVSNIANALMIPLREKEDKLARLIYESIQEATEDLGESISSSILQAVQGYLAPNWLEREVLPKILALDLINHPEKGLKQFKEILNNYLSTDSFLDEIKQICTILLNSSIGELLKKYGNKKRIVDLLCFLAQAFYNRGIIEKLQLKLEQEPLGQWLLTPKVRIELRERLLRWLSNLVQEKYQEKLYNLEKNYAWKKNLGEKAFDFLTTQPLDQMLKLLLSEEVKDKLAQDMTNFFKEFLREKMSSLILNMLDKYLKSLTQKEIRQLVNDLLGKELRPLSYLGGLVGLVTGLGVGMIGSNLPMTLSDSQGLLARSFIYGAIGYGTNVLAVHSLFKPYQAILGWQGLLPKNKHRFAKKMGVMTEKYVADEKIWQTYLGKWQNILENDFTDVQLILSPQRYFHIPLTGAWIDKPLHYFMKDGLDRILLDTADKSLKLFLQEEQLMDNAEKMIKEKLIPYFFKQFSTYSSTFTSSLWSILQEDGRLKLEANAEIFLHKKISRVFEKLEDDHFLEDRLASLHFPKQKTLYTFLAQKLMSYEDKLFSLFAKKERFFVTTLSDNLKHSLGFRAGLAYKMLGGDRYVARAVKIFLYKKLPLFLDEERDFIQDVLVEYYYDYLAGKSLTLLGNEIAYAPYRTFLECLKNQKVQNYIIVKGNFIVKKYFIRPLILWKNKNTNLNESISNYINKDLCYISMKNRVFPYLEHLLISLPRHALKPVLTEHLTLLFPHWIKHLSGIIGKWKLSDLINVDELHRLENMIYQEDPKPNKHILLMVRYYLRDGCTYLLPVGKKLLMREMKSLLIAFDFSTIASRAVDNKNEKELEALLRGIANPYFRHVERMGLLGAGVALPATFLSRFLM